MELFIITLAFIAGSFITLLFIDKKIIKNIRKSKNHVHFYVARDKNGSLALYLSKPFRGHTNFYADSLNKVFCLTYNIDHFGLKYEDFDSLKWEDEPVEVFLNL